MTYKYKDFSVTFTKISYKYFNLSLKFRTFEVLATNDFRSVGVGVYFDRWLLSKQLTVQLASIKIVGTLHKGGNDQSVYKF